MDGKEIYDRMNWLWKLATREGLSRVFWEIGLWESQKLADYLTYGESTKTGARLMKVMGIPIEVKHRVGLALHCEGRVLE